MTTLDTTIATLTKIACGCNGQPEEEEVLSKFEEGKPADPTKDMSPEDAKTWWQHHERNKDQFKTAMEFDTPEALQKYLKEHPGADKSNHHVKKPSSPEGGGSSDSKGHYTEFTNNALYGGGTKDHHLQKMVDAIGKDKALEHLKSEHSKMSPDPTTSGAKKEKALHEWAIKKLEGGKGKKDDEGGAKPSSDSVSLSKADSKSVGDLLEPFNEPGSWGHVVSYAISGKPMEPKHVQKVLKDIEGYLGSWDSQAKANGWDDKDKRNLTKAKGILEKASKGGGKTAMFEEGEPADPTENMSEEDAKVWWQHHQEHKDNFKAATVVHRDGLLDYLFNGLEHEPSEASAIQQLVQWDFPADFAKDLIQLWWREPPTMHSGLHAQQAAGEALLDRMVQKHHMRLASSPEGLNGYIAFWHRNNGAKQMEVQARTSLEAWQIAVRKFGVGPNRAHEVSVTLAEMDGKPVIHTPMFASEDKEAARVNLIPPADIRAKIPTIGDTSETRDPVVYIKYFSPYSNALWLVTEWDKADEMFGWAEIHPGMGELGYMSLSELQNLKGMGGRLPLVERDMWFKPKPLSQAKAQERRASVFPIRTASRSLSEIAREIRKFWPKPNYGAVPYLQAMSSMDDINEDYGMDSGKSVVTYFLSNATTWKGPDAQRIKAELKTMLRTPGRRYANVSPRLPAGTRVVLKARPASRVLYTRGFLPEDGEAGTVKPMSFGTSRRTFLPGPGGGLLYVEFDNGTFMGVSPIDLVREGASSLDETAMTLAAMLPQ